MKRPTGMSFEMYKDARKRQNELIREKIRGRLVWISAELINGKKVVVQGTRSTKK